MFFKRLHMDINAAKSNDPAARSKFGIWLTYSGVHALSWHRFANRLYKMRLRLPARILSQWAKFRTGIEIHPAAKIAAGVFIDHGAGVVIGETAEVGEGTVLYQGCTLGGTGKETGKRHPTLGNDVTVGVGASVLGDITLGDHSKVGGGAVVVKDVPDRCTVVGVPGHITTNCGVRVHRAADDLPGPETHGHRQYLPDPIDQTITILEARIQQLERRLASVEGEGSDQNAGV